MSDRERAIARVEELGLVPDCLGSNCGYPHGHCPCQLSPEEILAQTQTAEQRRQPEQEGR